MAAVNYHFGDKEGLYLAVIKHFLALSIRKYPPDYGLCPSPTPYDRLRAFIGSFLLRLLDRGQAAWFERLMAPRWPSRPRPPALSWPT